MASRQEDKERKRQERLEREAAEAQAAGRRKRLQLVGGALLAVAALVAIGIALVTVLDKDDGQAEGPKAAPAAETAAEKLPAVAETDLKAAAAKAKCTLTNPKYEGATHEERAFAASDYQTNPPTSGNHFPTWYEDGIYAPGSTPDLGQLVHTLEHGRIDVQYKPGTDAETVSQLEAFVGENDGYHMVMFENTTKMPYAVAATAWTHSLTCDTMSPPVFDALRTFRDEYLDKGPEQVP